MRAWFEVKYVLMAVVMISVWPLCGAGAIVDLGGEMLEIEPGYFAELVEERGEEIVITNGTLKSNGFSNLALPKFSLLTASSPCGPFTEYDVSAANYVSNLGMYIKMPNPTAQCEFYKVKLEFK